MIEVYAHTSPSGKVYVGLTSAGMLRRWSGHVKEAKGGRLRVPKADTRAKCAAYARNRPQVVLDKLSAAQRGRPMSESNKAALLAANSGRRASEETRAKLRSAQARRKAGA